MVWDQRGPSLLWRKPPWPSLASPSAFSNIDLSILSRGERLATYVGDLPNYFYSLKLPSWTRAFFVLDVVTAEELRAYAAAQGIDIIIPPGAVYCAMKVVVMGWS